jgi:CBS domain-containing protein
MKVKEIMHTNPKFIYPETTIQEAANIMKDIDIGFLPICNKEKIIGAITDRDIVIRAIAEDKDIGATKVEDIMSKKIIYCYEDDPIEMAAQKMEDEHIRRLIVVNNDKRLVGIISIGDISAKLSGGKLSGEIMNKVNEQLTNKAIVKEEGDIDDIMQSFTEQGF